MPRPIPQEAEWKAEDAFSGEYGERALTDLHERINEHVCPMFVLYLNFQNMLVISKYYSNIRMSRLSELCKLEQAVI